MDIPESQVLLGTKHRTKTKTNTQHNTDN